MIGKLGASASVLRTMRKAARTVVTSGHTFNLVRPADRDRRQDRAPAQFSGEGEEPAVPPVVRRVRAQGPVTSLDPIRMGSRPSQRTDSELAIVVLAYNSRAKGNAATEMVKYYLQLHYGIKKDYRNFYLMKSRDPEVRS